MKFSGPSTTLFPTANNTAFYLTTMIRFPLTALVTMIHLLTLGATAESSTWPQWRGPQRDGQFAGPAWPDKLDTNHLQRTWRVELGPSYSGPVVGTDRVFTTESKDKKLEVVRAFDRETGKELWSHQWQGSLSVPFFAKSNGDWVRSTPALDGDRLYVAGMRDVLVCLDARDGEEIWKVTGYARVASDRECVMKHYHSPGGGHSGVCF